MLACSSAFGAGIGLTLQGRILKPDSTPVNSASVQFRVQIRSPGTENCLLYEEIQGPIDMSSSSGIFAITVGAGTRSAAGIDGGYSFDRIFANQGSMNFAATVPSACALGTTYTPSLADNRKLVYYFNDGVGGWQTIPASDINWVPLAVEALQVSGFKRDNFLRSADASGNPLAAPALNAADVTELVALLNGTSTRYVQPSSAATFSSTITFSNAPQFSGVPSGANDITNKTYVDAAISTAVSGVLPNVGTAGTYYKVSTDAKGRVTSGAASLVAADIPNLDASKVTTGTFGGAVGINTTGNLYSSGTVTGGTVSATNLRIYNGVNYMQISASSMAGNLNWILPNTNGSAGQVLRTDGAGNLSWVAAPSGSVTGVTATAPLLSSGGATPDISLAQATGAVPGYLSAADFNTFNNKLSASSTFAGDVSGVYTATSVDRLKGAALSITSITSGNFLKYNGTNWINANLANADITTGLGFAPVNRSGDTMTGLLVLSADPAANLGSATKQYVDSSTTTAAANYIRKDGTVAFTANQSLGSNKLTFVADPTSAQDAATKNYADAKLFGKAGTAPAAGQDGQSLRWNNASLAWEYFASSAGSVTTVATGTGLTGGPITTNGTISLASTTVTAGSYGTSTSVPALTVDAQGRLTAVTSLAIPSANTSTTGLLTNTDWNTFNSKLGTTSTFVGDVSGVYTATSVDKLKGAALSITALTSGNFLKYNGTNWINTNLVNADITTGLGYAPVNKAGDSMTGLLVLSGDPTVNLGSVTKQYADTKILSKTATVPAAGQDGQSLRWNNASLAWDYYTPVTGTGLTNLNGATGNSQTFANGATGTTPAFSTAANVHTLNIPMANTASVTAGLISKTEYDTFNTKLGITSTFAGDVSGLYNSLSVDKLKGAPLSIASLTSGNFLKYNGANWVNANLSNTDITSGLGFAPVNKAGDSMTGLLVLSADPSANLGSATKQYVDAVTTASAGAYIRKDGTMAFTGTQSMGSNKLTFVTDPTAAQDAATKNYADTKIVGKTATAPAAGQDGQSLRWNNSNSSWEYYSVGSSQWTTSGSDIYYTTGKVSVGTATPSELKMTVTGGGVMASGTFGTDTTLTTAGAGTRMFWYPRKAAFRAGNANGTQWDDANIGTYSVALGDSSRATGDRSFGTGYSSLASGAYSTAMGYSSTASGVSATSLGNGTTASGDNSVAMGSSSTASATYAMTSGYNTTASGTASTATGYQAVSSGAYSTATGLQTAASGNASLAMGNNTTAESYAQVTLGQYNMPRGGETAISWVATDPVFVVGNGTGAGASRSTAMMILKNGNVGIGTTNPSYKLDVVGDVNVTGNFKINGTNIGSGAGTVTNIATGTGLSGGPITSTGTISLASTTVSAGSYGTSVSIPTFNVDAQGRLTGVTAQAIPSANTSTTGFLTNTDWNTFNSKLGTTSTFVGDVSGVYTATSVDKLKGAALSITSLTSGNFLKYNGTNWINTNLANADITTGLGYTPVSGTGTNGKIARFTASTTVADSIITESTGQIGIAGQIVSTGATNNGAATTFNFNSGNAQYSTAACAAMTLQNMVDGGSYTVAIKNTSGTCTFAHSSDTIKYAGGVANVTITSHTIFSFLKMGTDIYITWVSF